MTPLALREFGRCWTEPTGPPLERRTRHLGKGGALRGSTALEALNSSNGSGAVRAQFRAAAEKLFTR